MADLRVPEIPEDLLVAILLHLPAKSIARFRHVSKNWNRILHSPAFVKSHHTWKLESGLLLKYCRDGVPKLGFRPHGDPGVFSDNIISPPPSFMNGCDMFELLYSLNGIICLYTFNKDASDKAALMRNRIFLWNPTIHDFFTLPPPPSPVPENSVGFGFNPLSGHLDDFKVLCIDIFVTCKDRREMQSQVEIYSLRTNSWKQLGDCYPPILSNHLGNQVVVNEHICWSGNFRLDGKPFMPVFDVAKEEFGEIRLPDSMVLDFTHIGIVDECLTVFSRNQTDEYEVWMMKEFGNSDSWTKIYTIEMPSRGLFRYQPLGFVSIKEVLLVSTMYVGLRHRLPGYISSYDEENRRLTRKPGFTVDSIYGNRMVAHAKSLISPTHSAQSQQF